MELTMPVKEIKHTPIGARKPVIKLLGLGGAGSNAINRMLELNISGIDYIAANTDNQALLNCQSGLKINLGPKTTRGLGAGGNPSIGEAAARESYREIGEALKGADMVFLTAGMGGGTGSGAISVAAQISKSLGAVTIAIVTTPFSFEVGRRQVNAYESLEKLRPYTDTLITVPNDKLLQIAPQDLPLDHAFRLADDVLRQGVQGIAELVLQPGLINVDFSHVKQLMLNGGGAVLSIGYGQGENKGIKAVEQALNHPLLESIPVENASGIIANFTGGKDFSFLELSDALNHLHAKTNNFADIIPGVSNDDRMHDRTQVILVITGLGATPIITTTNQEKEPVKTDTTSPYKFDLNNLEVSEDKKEEPEPITLQHNNYIDSRKEVDLPAFMRKRKNFLIN